MTGAPLSFDRHLDTELSRGLAAVSQWRPPRSLAAELGPPVVNGDRYRAILALGPGGRRPVESGSPGGLRPRDPCRAGATAPGPLPPPLPPPQPGPPREALATIEQGPIPMGPLGRAGRPAAPDGLSSHDRGPLARAARQRVGMMSGWNPRSTSRRWSPTGPC